MSARPVSPRLSLRVILTAAAASIVLGHVLAAQAPSSLGRLQLRNGRWAGVRVELRVGPSQDCEQNSAQGVHVLRRDARWAVVSAETICWRREQVPGDPAAAWTPWEQARLAPDEIRDVTL